MQDTNRSGDGGRRACYVTPDLSYGQDGERKGRAKIINGVQQIIVFLLFLLCDFVWRAARIDNVDTYHMRYIYTWYVSQFRSRCSSIFADFWQQLTVALAFSALKQDLRLMKVSYIIPVLQQLDQPRFESNSSTSRDSKPSQTASSVTESIRQSVRQIPVNRADEVQDMKNQVRTVYDSSYIMLSLS